MSSRTPATTPTTRVESFDDTADTIELSPSAREFVELGVWLTGFPRFDLYATGMAELYLTTAREQVGPKPYDVFHAAWKAARNAGASTDPVHVEIARAITYLWYTGAWPRLAPAAHAALRRQVANVEFVVSPAAYTEGLVWRTFHGHPGGAKPPGHGTWSQAPPPLPSTDAILAEIDGDEAARGVPPTDVRTVLPGPSWAWFAEPSSHPTEADVLAPDPLAPDAPGGAT